MNVPIIASRILQGGQGSGSVLPANLLAKFSVLWAGDVSGNNLVDEISGQLLPITGKDFVGSIIPGTSTATLALPNTASLKTDDGNDNLWYTGAGTVRQVPIGHLFTSDYYRTLVKYSNTSPYDVSWFGLLKSDATLSSDELNQLHTYFQLHIYWSGVFNNYGVLKNNRALEGQGCKGWIARLNVLSLTNPSEAVRLSVHKTFLDINNGDYTLWDKVDALWCFMINDSALVTGASTVSIKTPGLARLTFPVAPTYTTSGFSGNAVDQYANTNFNPTLHAVNYTRDSACRIVYKYLSSGAAALDGHPSFTGDNAMQNASTGAQRINSVGNTAASLNLAGVGYMALDRLDGTNLSGYNGVTKTDTTATSKALTNESFSILRNAFGYGASGVSFYALAGHLTQAQHLIIKNAMDAHKTRLGL
jgi:hypothetical protein